MSEQVEMIVINNIRIKMKFNKTELLYNWHIYLARYHSKQSCDNVKKTRIKIWLISTKISEELF